MFTPDDALEHLHPKILAMIEADKAVCGCVMKAVKRVAARSGVSEHWLRRVTGRYGKVKIQAHQFFNVVRAYVAMKREKRRAARAAKAATNFPREKQPMA